MTSSSSSSPLFLGLDLSTQQLKAVIINDSLHIIHKESIQFSKHLPQFGTEDGVIRDSSSSRVFTPINLWISAIDLLLHRLSTSTSFSFYDIVAISGTAQQHGTVYWNEYGVNRLERMEDHVSMKLQDILKNGFSKEECPIWMDSSTGEFVDKFDDAIPDLNRISGSRAYHRFSGPQIAKIFKYERDTYNATTRISLVSSFLASIFLGRIAPIDMSDACGTNLLDIQSNQWSPLCLSVVVDGDSSSIPSLQSKLGTPVPAATDLGSISPYFVSKYGMNPSCKVIAFTGDNLSSMADLNTHEGDVIISLGTSDTAIYVTPSFIPLPRGHVFIHPTVPNQYVNLICYKNGSLTRERIRESLGLSWDTVGDILKETPVGNNGRIGIYFDMDEIEPRVSAGDYRWMENGDKTTEPFPRSTEMRAVLEGQCLHLRVNCPQSINRIILTGGASANTSIRQMMGDIFGRPIYTTTMVDSAAQGGAKRARYVYHSPSTPYEDYFKSDLTLVAEPIEENVRVYEQLLKVYKEREDSLMN